MPLAPSKCLSKWIKVDECDYFHWYLQATQAVKIQFEIDKKSSLLNLIFPNWFFWNQVQINRGLGRIGWKPQLDTLHPQSLYHGVSMLNSMVMGCLCHHAVCQPTSTTNQSPSKKSHWEPCDTLAVKRVWIDSKKRVWINSKHHWRFTLYVTEDRNEGGRITTPTSFWHEVLVVQIWS